MSNFLFLKKNNENLFNIIVEAEKLFRDEYFEQTVVQTRRFAENLCKDLLKDKAIPDETFDSMINRIKDNSFGNTRMTEFTEDLYFLKKNGNASAHSLNSSQDGKVALECLERAYEISVFYSNVKYGYNKKLDKSVFSEELLMTGKKSSPTSLKERYATELEQTRENYTQTKPLKSPKTKQKSKNSVKKSKRKMDSKNKTLVIVILVHIILIALCGWFFFNK